MSSVSNFEELAREAYRAGFHGEFSQSERWFADHGADSTPSVQAWAAVLSAQRWHAEPTKGAIASIEALRELLSESSETAEAVCIACIEAARAAVLAHDRQRLSECKSLLEQLADGPPVKRLGVGTMIVEAWAHLAAGDPVRGGEVAALAATRASKEQFASFVIEATAIGALCAEARGDLEGATSFARRASRMARTEDLPQWQYLANVVLARIRRINGAPHLGARIVGALARVVPESWNRWVAWEALLSGALPLTSNISLDEALDPRGATRLLRAVLETAVDGDNEGFRHATLQAQELDLDWHGDAGELTDALCALDPSASLDRATDGVRAWCNGEVPTPPGSIQGLCTDVEDEEDSASHAAYVLAVPAGGSDSCKARRVAGLGAPLIRAELTVPRTEGRSERTPATLSALALAGAEGLSRDDLFRSVYGFSYRHIAHRGLLKTLMHRVRRLVGEAGSVIDDGEQRFRLALSQSLLVPDPRSGRSLEERVLRLLARGGSESAKEAAERLGVSLRTAQLALKALVDEGALSSRKVGRSTEYQVEDTTFSEPTRW